MKIYDVELKKNQFNAVFDELKKEADDNNFDDIVVLLMKRDGDATVLHTQNVCSDFELLGGLEFAKNYIQGLDVGDDG